MRLSDYMVKEELGIQAYGTSDGANKGWDSRGRGRASKNFEPKSSVVPAYNSKVARMGGVLRAKGYVKVGAGKYQQSIGSTTHIVTVNPDGWRHTSSGGPNQRGITKGNDSISLRGHLNSIH